MTATIKLRKWNELTEEVKAPTAVLAALASGRSELLKLIPTKPPTFEETAALYNVIRVLMDTNRELQAHSQNLATQMEQVVLSLRGVSRKFDELREIANFTEVDAETEED